MKLQKRDLPYSTVVLPVCGKKVQYRPYTVKEERILMMAMSGEPVDPNAANDATIQIVTNCSSAPVQELCDADFEFLFLKISSVSVGSIHQITLEQKCELVDCPSSHPAAVNLDHLKVVGVEEWEKIADRRGEVWVIKFDANSGIGIKPKFTRGTFEDTVFASFQYYFEGDNVYDEFTKEEWLDWFECLPKADFDLIQQFFNVSPFCTINVKTACRKCGKQFVVDTRGVIDFLE
jgi:hypothetical protein